MTTTVVIYKNSASSLLLLLLSSLDAQERDFSIPQHTQQYKFKIHLRTLPKDIKTMLASIATRMTSDITAGKIYSNITGIQEEVEQKGVEMIGFVLK